MFHLQNETGCHNINFVTPEHVVPQVGLYKKKNNKLWNLNKYFLKRTKINIKAPTSPR